MKILHFTGQGTGWMTGFKEYLIITEDYDSLADDHCCPGFTLDSKAELDDDLPSSLPLERVLIPKD